MWDSTKLDLDHMVDTFDPTVKQVLLLHVWNLVLS